MPISTSPTTDHTRDPSLPIPLALRSTYSAPTQLRHALADYIERQYARQPLLHTRRAAVQFFREAGILPPEGRWVRRVHPRIADLVGVNCAHFLRNGGTTTVDEALARIRSYREIGEQGGAHDYLAPPPTIPDNYDTPAALSDIELTPAELRQAVRTRQRDNRLRFAEFLRSRGGRCNPVRVYRQWCRTYETTLDPAGFVARGLPKGRRTASDAGDRLGPDATRLITESGQIERAALAEALEKI